MIDRNFDYHGFGSNKPVKHLQYSGIENEVIVASAHRYPGKARELCITAQEKGFGVVTAAADMAVALPGVVSAYTSLPVI
ncbi:AIR carboxylase family protein [Chitinophaga sp. OAE865]|uniref:AIR carboxylase family protein n=1 Tax=Chitinophaga sp. OAE865 TaxID=2817898 RepID=UPI00339AF099